MVDHVWKIRDRKQRTDFGKYSLVNRNIKYWNHPSDEVLGHSFVNIRFLESDSRKQL
jgi:hypothetical protein